MSQLDRDNLLLAFNLISANDLPKLVDAIVEETSRLRAENERLKLENQALIYEVMGDVVSRANKP